MTRFKSRFALATALGLLASGTFTLATAAEAAAGTYPPTTKAFVTRNHHVHMPTSLSAGLNRILVNSGKDAALQLVSVTPGYTKARLAHDVNTGLNQGKVRFLKRFESHVTLLGGVASHPGKQGVLWVRLPAGTYWVADTNAHVTKPEQLLTIQVSGPANTLKMPRAHTVRAINEADWGTMSPSIPHTGILTFRNASEDNHFVAMAKLLPGKTVRDFRQWINKIKNGENPGPPPAKENVGIDSGVLSPGHTMAIHYSLPRGRYVLTCWWPDAEMGGMPHAFMGMIRGMRVR